MGELRLRTTTHVVDGKRVQRHECPLPITDEERRLTARLDQDAAHYGIKIHYYDRTARPWWRNLGGSSAPVAEVVGLSTAGAVAPARSRPRPAFRVVSGGRLAPQRVG
jgi:hypothetical protein